MGEAGEGREAGAGVKGLEPHTENQTLPDGSTALRLFRFQGRF